MDLVIIEAPNKKGSISKYLGSNYEIVASVGHVRDLPANDYGVKIDNNFEPNYVIMPDKTKIVKELKEKAKKADKIYLATDPDREGEAIAWHIAYILGLKPEEKCRVTFNEISKNAVQKGILEPRAIDENLVNAQQARRLLDRFVGYEISPILCKNIKNNLSAGRVQSVALKIVVDREREIQAFKPEEYHTLNVMLTKQEVSTIIKASLTSYNSKKIKPKNAEEMQKVVDAIKEGNFFVKQVKKSVTQTKPLPPFTTSKLLQDGTNKLGLSPKQTQRIAQQLYEGVELKGEGKVALVTYIRSDSVRVAPEAQKMAKEFILKNFGAEYYPSKPNVYKSKGAIQDAHEAIRPISLEYTPERIKSSVSSEVYKLYKLIYERFLASQMSVAKYNTVSVDIECNNYGFKASGRTPIFLGFNKVYKPFTEETEEEGLLPELIEGEKLNLKEYKTEQKFTKPSPRFTSATLINALEEKGIGRPATYAQIFSTIRDRGYIDMQGKSIIPTEIGFVVNDFLVKNFPTIINEDFTAQMETKLDDIAVDKIEWKGVVSKFYHHIAKLVNELKEKGVACAMATTATDKVCDKCGSPMVLKNGRNGGFYACSKYPECKNTKSLFEEKKVAICPNCGKNILEKTSKKGTKYYACEDYKNCKLMLWGIPTGEKCPECGGYLFINKGRSGAYIKCSNDGCAFTKDIQKKEENNEEPNN